MRQSSAALGGGEEQEEDHEQAHAKAGRPLIAAEAEHALCGTVRQQNRLDAALPFEDGDGAPGSAQIRVVTLEGIAPAVNRGNKHAQAAALSTTAAPAGGRSDQECKERQGPVEELVQRS